MSEHSPTRSAVLEMKDERRAMREGHVFLDEKCMLLAGEILRELAQYVEARAKFLALHDDAVRALQAAVARHGLRELLVYPAAAPDDARLEIHGRTLMGVRLQAAACRPGEAAVASAVNRSPEAEACRHAMAAVVGAAAPLAALSGNLERLSLEYRRSVRRARALQDVMLPELDHAIRDIEDRLEELEQEDAIWMRQGTR